MTHTIAQLKARPQGPKLSKAHAKETLKNEKSLHILDISAITKAVKPLYDFVGEIPDPGDTVKLISFLNKLQNSLKATNLHRCLENGNSNPIYLLRDLLTEATPLPSNIEEKVKKAFDNDVVVNTLLRHHYQMMS